MYKQPQLEYLENQTNTRFGNNIGALMQSNEELKDIMRQVSQNTSILAKTAHSQLSKDKSEPFNFENVQNSLEQQQNKIFTTFNRLSSKISKGFNLDWIDKFEERMADQQQKQLDEHIEAKSEYYGVNYTEANLVTRSANSLISKYDSFEAKQLAVLSGSYDIQRYILGRMMESGISNNSSNIIETLSKDFNTTIFDKLTNAVKSF